MYETFQTMFDLMIACVCELDHDEEHMICKVPNVNETVETCIINFICHWPAAILKINHMLNVLLRIKSGVRHKSDSSHLVCHKVVL